MGLETDEQSKQVAIVPRQSTTSSDRFHAFLETFKTTRAEKQRFKELLQEPAPESYERIKKRLSEPFVSRRSLVNPLVSNEQTMSIRELPAPEKDILRPRARPFYTGSRKNTSLDRHLQNRRKQNVTAQREPALV